MLGAREEALIALLEHVGDRVCDEVIFRLEVSVEGTVGQPGLGHQASDADSVGPYGADGRRRLTQYPVAGSLFMLVVVAHGSFIPRADGFVEWVEGDQMGGDAGVGHAAGRAVHWAPRGDSRGYDGAGAPGSRTAEGPQGLPTCTAVAWNGLDFASGPPRMAAN